MRFSDYYACPFCGCSLDPGERCDCQEREAQQIESKREREADRSPRFMSTSHYHRPAGITTAIYQ